MPVFIQQPDALDLLTKVEGPAWREKQERFGSCSFKAFHDEWLQAQSYLTEEDKASEWYRTDSLTTPGGDGAIYGEGGWNRYIVKYTGEIVFLRRQAWGPEAIQRAEEAGFRVWPSAP